MTTPPDEPVQLPDAQQVQAWLSEASLADVRSDEDRIREAQGASAQAAGLIDEGQQPHAHLDWSLENWPRPERGADLPPNAWAVEFEIFEFDERYGSRVLAVPGQLTISAPVTDEDELRRQQDLVAGRGYRRREPPPGSDCAAVRDFDQQIHRYESEKDVGELRRDINALRSEGLSVAPNYVVPLGHIIKGDDYPRPSAMRRQLDAAETTGPSVAVIDTGIDETLRNDHWLTRIERETADPDTFNIDLLDVLPHDDRLDVGNGHGSFVAGVIEQVAPNAKISVYRGTDTTGMGEEAVIARLMVQAACDGAEIIHLSLGTNTATDLPPVAMQLAVELIEQYYPQVLIVASAGNMGQSRPMWPAAFKQVVAVGALTNDMRPARFSNYGFWLTCSAVGVGVSSPFPKGFEPSDPNVKPLEFGDDDWALWTGTSFSAPQITGRVAQALDRFPQLAPRQALTLLLSGTRIWPGYGHVIRVLPGSG